MAQNKIVIRYLSGRILKGFTSDFFPNKDVFHIISDDEPGSKAKEVRVAELKAIFFVKDPAGNPKHEELKAFDPATPIVGRKIRVLFKDGEVLLGTTQGYQPNRPGFFVTPADPKSNNERCFVVSAATREVSFL